MMESNADMRHAIRYALTAIDEHLRGARIDWHDVRDVLKRAIGEERANVHLTAAAPRGGCGVKHTPGPWYSVPRVDGVHPSFVYAGDYASQGEPDLMVEIVSGYEDGDRHLIAAAPLMLEALDYLIHIHHGIGKDGVRVRPGERERAIEQAKAAVKAARGEGAK